MVIEFIRSYFHDLIAMISRFEHAGGDPISHPYQDLLRECGDKSFLSVT